MSNPFAQSSDRYAKFRPAYPPEVFQFINSQVEQKNTAWDCGTGNGQCAIRLADTFQNVYATDVSLEQLANATRHERIVYSNHSSEKTNFPDHYFDLITVAQAVHWFDFEKFYAEVNRTLKPNGVIAIVGYGLLNVSSEVDSVIRDFYKFTGPYWNPQRKYLDDEYKTIPFPFNEIDSPDLTINVNWSLNHLVGFLNTWSAVKHFIKAECYNPVDELFPHLKDSWGDVEFRQVNFPLYLRIGKKLPN